VTDLAAGLLAGTQIPARVPTAKPQPAGPAPLRSDDLKSKVTAPFSAVTGKKKQKQRQQKQGAPARPGSPNGNGRAVSVKNKSGALGGPAVRTAPQGAKPERAEVRDAQLVLARLEPFSVMKFSFILSIVGWVALFIVVAVAYFFLSTLGVFHSIEHTIGMVTSSKGNAGTNASSWFSAGTVLGFTMIAGAIDVVIITALATIGAVLYNWVTRLTGGIEVTLAEAD